jgi:(p)ppGpp synthase/HD superfamily hydrolase
MNNSPLDKCTKGVLALYHDARQFAIDIHNKRGYTYGGLPYEVHLQMVVNFALRFRGTLLVSDDFFVRVLAALWLHDVVEDCGITYNDVKVRFGEEVADIVWALSGFGKNRKERNECVMVKIKGNVVFTFAKLCDKFANYTFGKFVDVKSKMSNQYEEEWISFSKENYITDLHTMYEHMNILINFK